MYIWLKFRITLHIGSKLKDHLCHFRFLFSSLTLGGHNPKEIFEGMLRVAILIIYCKCILLFLTHASINTQLLDLVVIFFNRSAKILFKNENWQRNVSFGLKSDNSQYPGVKNMCNIGASRAPRKIYATGPI